MNDFKSKLPDFQELGDIFSKFFKDMRTSVEEIIHDYKQKHNDSVKPAAPTSSSGEKTTRARKTNNKPEDHETY